MSLTLVKDDNFNSSVSTTDDLLNELSRYGNPRVFKFDGGWHASISVFVTGEGIEFEAKSKFSQETPKIALTQCYNRLMDAIAKIKET